MHQLVLLLASSLLLSGSAYAQAGLRAGGNLTNFHTILGDNFRTQGHQAAGYQVGVYYHFKLGQHVALVPEVQFSRERVNVQQDSYNVADVYWSSDYRAKLSYLNVPVLLRATLGPVYVEAGPQGSLLLGGRQVGTSFTYSGWTNTSTTANLDEPATDHYRRFDVGPCLGVGVSLPAGLGLSVRAYRGLVSLPHNLETAGFGFGGFSQVYRQSLQASLTYQVPTKQ